MTDTDTTNPSEITSWLVIMTDKYGVLVFAETPIHTIDKDRLDKKFGEGGWRILGLYNAEQRDKAKAHAYDAIQAVAAYIGIASGNVVNNLAFGLKLTDETLEKMVNEIVKQKHENDNND